MKTFIAGMLFGMLISSKLALASSVHAGDFWNRLDSASKYGYVNGYSDAMRFCVTELGQLKAAADVFHWKSAPAILRQLSNQLSSANLDTQSTINQLNKVYSDPKNNELDLSEALELLTIRTNEAPGGRSKESH